MKILLNKEVDINKWNDLLNRAEQSSPFQTPAYYEFFNSMENLSATVHAVEHNVKIEALCVVTLQKEKGLKGYFSRRAIVYGGPVLSPTVTTKHISLLLYSINSYYKKQAIYIEIRNFFDYDKFKSIFKTNDFQFVPWLNFHLHVENQKQVSAAISKSRLRQIKKAVKQGVTWQVAETEEDVMNFYFILKDLYHSKIKKPLFAPEFFLHFFRSNVGKFLLVYFNNMVIGGIMCPIIPNRSIYEFYVCGKDREYKKQYPSIMATWAAIEYAQQNNIPLFDFMGAGSPAETYGVREFKARFGGKLVAHGRYLKVLNPFFYKLGKIGVKLISKLS